MALLRRCLRPQPRATSICGGHQRRREARPLIRRCRSSPGQPENKGGRWTAGSTWPSSAASSRPAANRRPAARALCPNSGAPGLRRNCAASCCPLSFPESSRSRCSPSSPPGAVPVVTRRKRTSPSARATFRSADGGRHSLHADAVGAAATGATGVRHGPCGPRRDRDGVPRLHPLTAATRPRSALFEKVVRHAAPPGPTLLVGVLSVLGNGGLMMWMPRPRR